MSKRVRTVVLVVTGVVVGVPALWIFLSSPYNDATPRAKMSEAFAELAAARIPLAEDCADATLRAGMNNASFGLPKRYKPGQRLRSVSLRVETPRRVLVVARLENIYFDWRFWRTLEIPAGAKIVMRGTCNGRSISWVLDPRTTVPQKYLPAVR